MTTLDPLLTPRELAALLRVSEGTVRTWAYRRRIPSQKVGDRLRFSAAAVRRWLEEQARPAMQPVREER
jgi:excisionase family DNA binding protein